MNPGGALLESVTKSMHFISGIDVRWRRVSRGWRRRGSALPQTATLKTLASAWQSNYIESGMVGGGANIVGLKKKIVQNNPKSELYPVVHKNIDKIKILCENSEWK